MSNNEHQRLFDLITSNHSDLLRELHSEIDDFVDGKDEFTSKEAGRFILKNWNRSPDWVRICGNNSHTVFGVALYDYFKDSDWNIGLENSARVYSRGW